MAKMHDETKQIAPIETGVIVPPRSQTFSFGKKISIVATLRKLTKGQSFQIDDYKWRTRVTSNAHWLGIKVKTQKLDDGKLRVIRL